MKLCIEKNIYGGSGLARAEGKAIFVPFTLGGELVEARVTEDHASHATAELESMVEPSPQRAAPPCPYFGECGGCHYQHAAYAHQVEMKVQVLRETLERAHLWEIPEITAIPSEPLGYRNRIRLHIDPGTSALCYKRRSSHVNLPVSECPIAAPVLQQALQTIQAQGKQWPLGKHFEEIELFTDAQGTSILATLWSRRGHRVTAEHPQMLWKQLPAAIPAVSGMRVVASEKGNTLAQAGGKWLNYAGAGQEYRVSMGSFFQVNRFLIDTLVDRAIGDRRGKLAWDLYAGVGLFSRVLGSRFEHIVAVESASSSVHDLRHNLNGTAHRIVASSTLDFLRRERMSRQPRPEFVLVDPPRAGLGKEVTSLLSGIRPQHITYVSCDPATLSRDLKSLLDSGYQLRNMHMVDLFPQTFHLESVATLSLN